MTDENMDFPQDDDSGMLALGREMVDDMSVCKENIALRASKSDPRWRWNERVYAPQRGAPGTSERVQDFGLELAGRDAPRGSAQAQMSDDGIPLGNLSRPFELLTTSQVMQLRRLARTAKGRRRLQLLIGMLTEAGA